MIVKQRISPLLAIFIALFLGSCALEPIASIEDQQAALGVNFDTSVTTGGGNYEDDEYEDDEEKGEYEGTSSISNEVLNLITAYVTANYPGQSINEMEREGNAIEVELSNGLELYFDLNGNFLGTED